MERTGRGVNRAFESQLALGRSAPDYNLSNPRTVVVRVRPRLADKKMAGLIAEARQQGDRFSLQDLLALHEVRIERGITTARAAELFQVGVREAREVLNHLTDRGLLETTGRTRDRTYNLSAAVYHRLGEPARHAWVRGSTGSNRNRWCSPSWTVTVPSADVKRPTFAGSRPSGRAVY